MDSQGNLSLLLNNGAAGFTVISKPLGLPTAGLVVADFNNDGNSDIAVALSTSDDLAVLLGDGKGGFTTLYQSVGGLRLTSRQGTLMAITSWISP